MLGKKSSVRTASGMDADFLFAFLQAVPQGYQRRVCDRATDHVWSAQVVSFSSQEELNVTC